MIALSPQQQQTVRSAARWAVAVVVLLALNAVVAFTRIPHMSFRDAALLLVSIAVTAWQVLGLAIAGLAFSARPTTRRFEAGLMGLRTFAKVGVLTFPLLGMAAGFTCNPQAHSTAHRGAGQP